MCFLGSFFSIVKTQHTIFITLEANLPIPRRARAFRVVPPHLPAASSFQMPSCLIRQPNNTPLTFLIRQARPHNRPLKPSRISLAAAVATWCPAQFSQDSMKRPSHPARHMNNCGGPSLRWVRVAPCWCRLGRGLWRWGGGEWIWTSPDQLCIYLL